MFYFFLGQELKRHRKSVLVCSMKNISKNTGIRPTQLSSWESGKTLPTKENLIRISEGYNISIEELEKLRQMDLDERNKYKDATRTTKPKIRNGAIFDAKVRCSVPGIRKR